MGSELVVGFAELVENALLEVEVRRGRARHFFLEGFVESFVGAILLRAAGGDALVDDPELEPPDVEAVETVDA